MLIRDIDFAWINKGAKLIRTQLIIYNIGSIRIFLIGDAAWLKKYMDVNAEKP